MSEFRAIRLAKAATSYNVAIDHIVTELKKNGITVENNPTAKLTPEMVVLLDNAFYPDKALKKQAMEAEIREAIKEFHSTEGTELSLNGIGLTEIPDEILSLTNLKGLYLKRNFLTEISGIERLVNLEKLHIGGNQIKYLSGIGNLKKLQELDLESNRIDDITPLYYLTNLRLLNLSNNPMEVFSSFEVFKKLSTLKFSKTKITDLSFLKSTKINELHARYNGIKDVAAIGSLESLRVLNLAHNYIEDINALAGLKNLVELDLESNRIEDLSALKNLNLQRINLNHNKIEDLNPLNGSSNMELTNLLLENNKIEDISPLTKMNKLINLNLRINKIKDISALKGLENLIQLDLSHNLIEDIEPLKGKNKLDVLSLSSNKVSDLDALTKLEQLKIVFLDLNPVIETIPSDVINSGWKSIQLYLNEIKKVQQTDRISLNEAKILLLGNTNVGKSNLLEYLKTRTIPQGNETTVGLNYQELSDDENLCELEGNERANFHFWDFGGQEYFHATHKLFFSTGALHLVLWSKSKELRENQLNEKCFELRYWLRCIQQLSKEDKPKSIETIVVENKIDIQEFRTSPLNQMDLANEFEEINFSFSAISIKTNKRLKGLKELIGERIKTLPTFSRKDYTNRYKVLLNQIKDFDKSVININDLLNNDFSREDIEGIIPVFHNMGVLLYFKEVLPEKIFAKPLELLDLLYKHILTKEAKNNNGRLKKEEIADSIKRNDSLGLELEEVLVLLMHFDLIFKIEGNLTEYFAPQYLQETMHGYLQFFLTHNFKKAPIKIQCDNYLMSLALLKTFSRYGKSVKNEDGNYLFWKDGIVIEKDAQILLVKFENEEQSIYLYNDSHGDNFYLCKEVIDFILSLSENIEFKEAKSSNANEINWHLNTHFSVFVTVDGFNYSSYKKIRLAHENHLYKFEEKGYTFKTFDFKQYLPINSSLFMKKIFISYSAEDGHFRNELEKHLSGLKRSGYIETWHCGKLIPGQKWDETIKKQFDESDIVLFLVSPDFMATDYIHDIEIQKAFDRNSDIEDDFKIVPIVIRYCDWETQLNNLKDFTALPYKAKPIKSFEDQDKGWYTVIERLKWIISKENYSLPKDVLLIEERN